MYADVPSRMPLPLLVDTPYAAGVPTTEIMPPYPAPAKSVGVPLFSSSFRYSLGAREVIGLSSYSALGRVVAIEASFSNETVTGGGASAQNPQFIDVAQLLGWTRRRSRNHSRKPAMPRDSLEAQPELATAPPITPAAVRTAAASYRAVAARRSGVVARDVTGTSADQAGDFLQGACHRRSWALLLKKRGWPARADKAGHRNDHSTSSPNLSTLRWIVLQAQ